MGVQGAARLTGDGVGQEGGKQSIETCDRREKRRNGGQGVGGCERGGILEVYLILPRSLLMMRALGLNAHFLERQANLTAHVLGAVEGRDVAVTGAIVRDVGRIAGLVALEQVKFTFGAE